MASEQMRKIALCSSYEAPAAGQPLCSDRGQKIERVLELPRNVQPDAKPNVINYETWGVILKIYVTERGLFFIPKPDDVKRSEVQTDTVFLHSTMPQGSDLEGKFEQGLSISSGVWPEADPKGVGRYVPNEQRDRDFIVYEYRIGNEEAGKGSPYPPEFFRPKSGAPIYFDCVKSLLKDYRTDETSCSVRDFGRKNLQLHYSLSRKQIRNWKHYSDMLWQYIDAHTIPTGGNT